METRQLNPYIEVAPPRLWSSILQPLYSVMIEIVADRKIATSLVLFHQYAFLLTTIATSLFRPYLEGPSLHIQTAAKGASSLGYAGRRTGSDPPSEGIHRISCGYEIPSFEGIMSHNPLKQGEISVDHLKRVVYDLRCLVANQPGHMNAGWEAGCRGNTLLFSLSLAWCASILSWCPYC